MYQKIIWNFLRLFSSALMIACKQGNSEIVQLLIEKDGIDINARIVYLISLGFYGNIWN